MLLTYHLSSQRSALRVERAPGHCGRGGHFMKGRNQCGGSRPFPFFWLGETRAAGFARWTRSEELRAVRSRRGAELLPAEVGDDAAARRALKETELQQERLVHVLDRVLLPPPCGGPRREPHPPPPPL